MTRVLVTTVPITGHVRPALPVVRELVRSGHEVVWYTGAKFASLVTDVGARYAPMRAGWDYDDADLDTMQAEHKAGRQRLGWALLNVFVKPIPGYAADIDELIDVYDPEVIVADLGFPAGILAAERRGVPSVAFTISPLGVSSVDTAPFGLGLPPSSSPLGRLRNRSLNWAVQKVVFADSQRAAEQIRAGLGLPPLPGYFMDWGPLIADRYVHASIPELEYPRSDLPPGLEFVGAMLPEGVDGWTQPAWWPSLAEARRSGRPVVLVTQGTIATDPANLLLPSIRALADRDALVVATTGGAHPDAVLPAAQRPANLRLERFVPFGDLLPAVDVMVTNGGFGGVQAALAAGVPLVVAGTTEDKTEVNARVAWSGAGISLRTDTPTGAQVAGAVDRVLAEPGFRRRAAELRDSYAAHRGAPRAAEIILEVAAASELITV
jgi:UDP:flavonoid glycosyltransferase YjiC (YdhE family)